jgi:hypothetical protein
MLSAARHLIRPLATLLAKPLAQRRLSILLWSALGLFLNQATQRISRVMDVAPQTLSQMGSLGRHLVNIVARNDFNGGAK